MTSVAAVPSFTSTMLGAPDLHETHSGMVILLGELAYKLKKPVDLGFLDFRSPEARTLACHRELELNRRLSPDVYLDVATFARTDGTPDEPVLVMRRMPDERRLSTLISHGVDVDDDLRLLARRMAVFHAAATRSPAIGATAEQHGLRRRWSDNLHEARPYVGSVLDAELFARIGQAALRFVDGRSELFSERVAAGYAVDGHGDLIADDIFCLADGPRILDCLEFDDALRRVDVLDDMAFLAMDFERLGRADLATRLMQRYAEFSGTPIVDALRHHYIAYRAFVRAKVECIRAAQGDPAASGAADNLARLALSHLKAGEVRLVLVGGAPGTGKTTVARALADHLGASLLSTDAIRPEQPGPDSERYAPQAKAATYRLLLERARHLLERGESVIADATWGELAWRRKAGEVAASTISSLVQLECHAPADIAAARAELRLHADRDLSAAGAAVARTLAIHRDPWQDAISLDTSGSIDESIRRAGDIVSDLH